MLQIASRFKVAVVGGDTVCSPFVFISVTVFGNASNEAGRVMSRCAAKSGDKIAVTGYLGASAGGLKMMTDHLKFNLGATSALRNAHLKPNPRVAEGQLLVAKGVKAGMDISDGLVGDLTHICEMSLVGARINIDSIPVSPVTRECFREKALGLALSGGEDYELLFTAPDSTVNKVKKTLDCPVTVIGEITAAKKGRVILVNDNGDEIDLTKRGWDHFA